MATKDITDQQVVQACRDWFATSPAGPGSLARLVAMTEQPEKVCRSALGRASRRGLIDWGVSIDLAWPTPAGEQLLTAESTAARG